VSYLECNVVLYRFGLISLHFSVYFESQVSVFADCSVKILDAKFGNILIVSLYLRNPWRVSPLKFHHAFTVNHADSPGQTRMSH